MENNLGLKQPSLPTTMCAANCDYCHAVTAQTHLWSYQTIIGQYCHNCRTFWQNVTFYSRATSRHQNIITNYIRDMEEKAYTKPSFVVLTVRDVPMMTRSLMKYSPELHPDR